MVKNYNTIIVLNSGLHFLPIVLLPNLNIIFDGYTLDIYTLSHNLNGLANVLEYIIYTNGNSQFSGIYVSFQAAVS